MCSEPACSTQDEHALLGGGYDDARDLARVICLLGRRTAMVKGRRGWGNVPMQCAGAMCGLKGF